MKPIGWLSSAGGVPGEKSGEKEIDLSARAEWEASELFDGI